MDAHGVRDNPRVDYYLDRIPLARIVSIQVKAAPPALVEVQGPPFEQCFGLISATVLILASEVRNMMIVSFSNYMSNQLQ